MQGVSFRELLLLLICILKYSFSTICSLKPNMPVLRDTCSQEQPFRVYSDFGFLMCVERCALMSKCRALQFNREHLHCALLELNASSLRLKTRRGDLVMEVASCTTSDGCLSDQCSGGTRCLRTRHTRANRILCVPDGEVSDIQASCDEFLVYSKGTAFLLRASDGSLQTLYHIENKDVTSTAYYKDKKTFYWCESFSGLWYISLSDPPGTERNSRLLDRMGVVCVDTVRDIVFFYAGRKGRYNQHFQRTRPGRVQTLLKASFRTALESCALDTTNRQIYLGPVKNAIIRINYDGSNKVEVTKCHVTAMFLLPGGSTLYWAETYKGSTRIAHTHVHVIMPQNLSINYTSTECKRCGSFVVSGDRLYYICSRERYVSVRTLQGTSLPGIGQGISGHKLDTIFIYREKVTCPPIIDTAALLLQRSI